MKAHLHIDGEITVVEIQTPIHGHEIVHVQNGTELSRCVVLDVLHELRKEEAGWQQDTHILLARIASPPAEEKPPCAE